MAETCEGEVSTGDEQDEMTGGDDRSPGHERAARAREVTCSATHQGSLEDEC